MRHQRHISTHQRSLAVSFPPPESRDTVIGSRGLRLTQYASNTSVCLSSCEYSQTIAPHRRAISISVSRPSRLKNSSRSLRNQRGGRKSLELPRKITILLVTIRMYISHSTHTQNDDVPPFSIDQTLRRPPRPGSPPCRVTPPQQTLHHQRQETSRGNTYLVF